MFFLTNTHYIKAIPLFLHMVKTQGIKMKKFLHKWKQNRVFNYQTSNIYVDVNDLHWDIGENENHMP
jgi:hypothetical protein